MTAAQAPAIPAGGLVVFDFDHTLFRGDSGTGLMVWMLRSNPLRAIVAMLASPLIAPLFLWPSTRRIPISIYLWIATIGVGDGGIPAARIADYVGRNAVDLRARLHPAALAALHAHRAGGDAVVIATGAPAPLVHAILALATDIALPVIGSTSAPCWGGRMTARHCHAENKLSMLREAGFEAPIVRAYSDSTADLPLLRAAREPVVVNPRPRRVPIFRDALGVRVPVLEWGGR